MLPPTRRIRPWQVGDARRPRAGSPRRSGTRHASRRRLNILLSPRCRAPGARCERDKLPTAAIQARRQAFSGLSNAQCQPVARHSARCRRRYQRCTGSGLASSPAQAASEHISGAVIPTCEWGRAGMAPLAGLDIAQPSVKSAKPLHCRPSTANNGITGEVATSALRTASGLLPWRGSSGEHESSLRMSLAGRHRDPAAAEPRESRSEQLP